MSLKKFTSIVCVSVSLAAQLIPTLAVAQDPQQQKPSSALQGLKEMGVVSPASGLGVGGFGALVGSGVLVHNADVRQDHMQQALRYQDPQWTAKENYDAENLKIAALKMDLKAGEVAHWHDYYVKLRGYEAKLEFDRTFIVEHTGVGNSAVAELDQRILDAKKEVERANAAIVAKYPHTTIEQWNEDSRYQINYVVEQAHLDNAEDLFKLTGRDYQGRLTDESALEPSLRKSVGELKELEKELGGKPPTVQQAETLAKLRRDIKNHQDGILQHIKLSTEKIKKPEFVPFSAEKDIAMIASEETLVNKAKKILDGVPKVTFGQAVAAELKAHPVAYGLGAVTDIATILTSAYYAWKDNDRKVYNGGSTKTDSAVGSSGAGSATAHSAGGP